MKCFNAAVVTMVMVCSLSAANSGAAEGRVHLRKEGTNLLVQIEGEPYTDWHLQVSTNLETWTDVSGFGVLLAGPLTNAPRRILAAPPDPGEFQRARRTEGLFDPSLFRTVSLTFTQRNWITLLANARTTGSNVYCSMLSLDNDATNVGVGARYKGNTSYTQSGTKKSINLELDWTDPAAHLMGYTTINLNNAAGDETIMREALYFTIMSQYTPCPKGAMTEVDVNGALWGVYSLVQQENGQLVREWFPSNDGDRWRTPNAPGGGGGFSGSNSALSYLSTTNLATYQTHYDLRTTNSPSAVAWSRLVNAIYVLNTTPTNQLRDKVEDVLAVDRWLWFLVLENVFADDDSYFNKGADYSFYYEPESGRIHPLEHDGNEAFNAIDVQLSPVQGATGGNRPVIQRLLGINELRQRYLAHLRTVLRESYNPTALTPWINAFQALSINAIIADPNKAFTVATYTNDLTALKNFIATRFNFLTNHAELRPLPPDIGDVTGPATPPTATEVPWITTRIAAGDTNGLDSVWLYHRGKSYGRFAAVQMLDDGAHGDGLANDGIFGAATTNYPAGTKVRFYVEARAANSSRAAAFDPPRAEQQTYSYRVAITTASNTPVIINELMASNTGTIADPQGEYDDWIELHNVTDQPVNLTGRYLSDEPNNPRKWAFPPGTTIPPEGYLLIWADEDGTATPGLHASFKLSAEGEEVFLTDTDTNFNAILDHISFGPQETGRSYGRTAADADTWVIMDPTPGLPNQ
jgi:hypothetical protein